MPRMPDLGATSQIICACCDDVVDEWANLSFSPVLSEDSELQVDVCPGCLDVMSVLLGTDFDENPEGMFRVSLFGNIEQYKQDCN